jgi:phosphoserine phosphatase RsbU/P
LPSSIPIEIVRTALRTHLPYVAVAAVVFAAGIASTVLSRLRSRDRLLLWLGVFASLYGLRLFVQNDLIRTAIGADRTIFWFTELCLTYVIPIPYAAFARELLGKGWRQSIAIWLWVQIAFAPLSIAFVAWTRDKHATDHVNNVLIIAGTLLVVLHLFLRRSPEPTLDSLKWPMLVASVLVFGNNLGFQPAHFDAEPLGFLVLLAALGYTASRRAIARERKLTEVEQELATARQIQASILPRRAPSVTTLQIAARYEPMTAVAGDFYDFLQTGEDSLSILIADVSGHGVPAALVASMLKMCFAAQRDQARDPARVLSGFNSMLSDVLVGQYVTAACAAIDIRARTVTYAGAGHPPALLLSNNNREVTELAENGLFLGPFRHATYTNLCVPFKSGDKLLLYTDGIIEANVADGEQFGRERLVQFLQNRSEVEPAHLIAQLFAQISTDQQEDDLTAVLVQAN